MQRVKELVREADVTLPHQRQLEIRLNDKTLQDLVAVYLQQVCLISSSEDVTDVTISAPDYKGVRIVRFTVEPDIQTIYHT